jgi:hypothetical protein
MAHREPGVRHGAKIHPPAHAHLKVRIELRDVAGDVVAHLGDI